jgi:hypothetical protein
MPTWKSLKLSEHQEQSKVIQWANAHSFIYAPLGLLYAIPNGGLRNKIVGKKLKREGVKKDFPDLCLPVARKGKHALYIEMKIIGGEARPGQLVIKELLEAQGNQVVVCQGADDAISVLLLYLVE